MPELFESRFEGGPRLLRTVSVGLERATFRTADAVISTNESYRRAAIERGGLPPDRVRVVRSAPDLTRFVPVEPDPELRRGKRFLACYLGVMGPQDGVDYALRALAHLHHDLGRDDLHSTFIGGGDAFDESVALAQQLGLGDVVEFTGRVPDETVQAYLSTADVCLSPDPRNPLNDVSSMNKVVEYMAMSRPAGVVRAGRGARHRPGRRRVRPGQRRARVRAPGGRAARRPRAPRAHGRPRARAGRGGALLGGLEGQPARGLRRPPEPPPAAQGAALAPPWRFRQARRLARAGRAGCPGDAAGEAAEAMEAIALEPVDSITVTTLVDNVADSLLPDQGPARRPSMKDAPRLPAPLLVGGDTDDALRAEHGFSALVTVGKGGRETRVLFDAGRTPDGLVENMRRLGLSPADIDIIVLSHGHWDHVTGMDGLVGRLGRAEMPVLIHPEFWSPPTHRAAGARAGRAPHHQQERASGRRLRDRRGAHALLPARRLAAGDRRGQPHDRVRDAASRDTRPTATASGGPTP